MASFLDDFTRDIPRGLSSRYLKQQTAPQARWQTPEVILERKALDYDPRNPGGKILVGSFGPKLVGIEDNRHILTVAGNRAGKSVTLINNLLFYRGSVLSTDPKGELANITAARRAALGQKVHVLDPFGSTAPRIAHLRKS
ncbi:MAG: type IV secretory system conjugative DNA transfer family protein, partial [Xanthobacteraceae bacterium]